MTVWIVVSILLVVLSPLAWLRPSRHQSGRMALRMEARRIGLAMQLAPQEWPHWLSPGAAEPLRAVPSAAAWQSAGVLELLAKIPGVWVNQWQEACEDPALLNHFEKLPANVYKVEADKQMITLYWGEKGEAEVLQQIDATLKALA